MKRFKPRRNRKYVDLVELVRNRFRFQPYRFHSNANISSRSNTRIIPNMRSKRFASSENLPKYRRQRLGRSKRGGVVSRSAAEGEPHSSGSISVSPACSSALQTHRDETSQTSIPEELRHLLLDDTKHSEDEDDEDEEEAEAEAYASAAEAPVEAEEHNNSSSNTTTNTEEPSTSNAPVIEQNIDKSPSCSTENRSSTCSTAAVQAMVDSDPDEPDETEEAAFAAAQNEAEDGEDTEASTADTASADERTEHESDSDNLLHDHRSQLLPEEEAPADEEAGGDGHHNNSVIEIEITLTSGNDSNSEEDENDTDAIGDEESEDI